MTDMIQISRAELTRIHALLGAHLGEEAAAALSKVSKSSKKAAKADAPKVKREGGAHAAWSAKMTEEFALVKEAYTAARVAKAEAGELLYEADSTAVKQGKHQVGEAYTVAGAKAGIHLVWAAEQKRTRAAEYEAFVAAHAAAHPKSAAGSVADDASVAESAPPSEEGEAKPKKGRKPMTEEAKAAAAAKRAATKAAKAAPAPADAAPAPVVDVAVEEAAVDLGEEAEEATEEAAEEVEDEFLPFSIGKTSYLRFGHINSDDETVWHEGGHLWLAVDGERGAYAGKLNAKGKLDTSEAAMADEPELE
jgi:hypothetical protein